MNSVSLDRNTGNLVLQEGAVSDRFNGALITPDFCHGFTLSANPEGTWVITNSHPGARTSESAAGRPRVARVFPHETPQAGSHRESESESIWNALALRSHASSRSAAGSEARAPGPAFPRMHKPQLALQDYSATFDRKEVVICVARCPPEGDHPDPQFGWCKVLGLANA